MYLKLVVMNLNETNRLEKTEKEEAESEWYEGLKSSEEQVWQRSSVVE